MRQDRLGAYERTRKVDIDNKLPILEFHLYHWNTLDDSCIVYQDVDGTDVLFHIFNELLHLIFPGNITKSTICVDTGFFVLFHATLIVLGIYIIKYYLCTGLCVSLCISKSKSVGSTGHPCDLTVESEAV